ncbi:MAG: NADH-quinone oxidoreductase subunit C [Planctomycetaceae bacterium]|nr:NADH-quinone oxidoreductase subunit C [Planctomycetaceae bacterium]
MSGQAFVDQLKQKFGDDIVGANLENVDPWVEVTAQGLLAVCQHLHDEPSLAFDYLNSVTAVDYLETDPKKAAKADFEPHMQVVYHLFSMQHKHSLVLKVIVPRWRDDVPGQLPEVPSVAGIWATADWHERECFDLLGVKFTDHPNLRRILCPEDWVGYPLRKDYEMPTEYHGIRGR